MTNEKNKLIELTESNEGYSTLRKIEIEHERKMTIFDEKPSDKFSTKYSGKKFEGNSLEEVLVALSPEKASHYTQNREVLSLQGVGGLIRVGKAKIKISYLQKK